MATRSTAPGRPMRTPPHGDSLAAMRVQHSVTAPASRPTDDIGNEPRFGVWTVADAQRLGAWTPELVAGIDAGMTGAPCPGPARSDPYRLGWEMGAIAVWRVPVPDWMKACNAQAEHECEGSA